MKVKTDIIIHISAMPTGSVVKKIDNVCQDLHTEVIFFYYPQRHHVFDVTLTNIFSILFSLLIMTMSLRDQRKNVQITKNSNISRQSVDDAI
jgi:hypothetical protein